MPLQQGEVWLEVTAMFAGLRVADTIALPDGVAVQKILETNLYRTVGKDGGGGRSSHPLCSSHAD